MELLVPEKLANRFIICLQVRIVVGEHYKLGFRGNPIPIASLIPKAFYLSGNAEHFHHFVHFDGADYTNELVLGASKEPLFDSMFHIAIENIAIANFFTEKIIDCFQTKTVPIYYGCRNIEDYFNTVGMFRVNNINEIIELCNLLTPELYERMLPALEDNFERSNKWCNQMEQLKKGITLILKEEGYV